MKSKKEKWLILSGLSLITGVTSGGFTWKIGQGGGYEAFKTPFGMLFLAVTVLFIGLGIAGVLYGNTLED